jgi:hypothetical protein
MDRAQESAGPKMTKGIILAILSLAVLMWVETASAQKTYSLSVSRHRDVPALSEEKVRAILAAASRMLKKNSRHNDDDDVACNVTFTLRGEVRTFASRETPKVVNREHIEQVHRVDSDAAGDFHVKVVETINFCRPGLDGPFQGCSFSPPDFRSMIVVHPKIHKGPDGRTLSDFPDHLLWAHEFGHLTGLGHRRLTGSNDPERFALMTPCPLTELADLPATRVRVNRAECGCLLSGPGTCPLPGPILCQRRP